MVNPERVGLSTVIFIQKLKDLFLAFETAYKFLFEVACFKSGLYDSAPRAIVEFDYILEVLLRYTRVAKHGGYDEFVCLRPWKYDVLAFVEELGIRSQG